MGFVFCVKVALTVLSVFMVTVQGPVPEQGLLHPEKEWPFEGLAVRVTVVLRGKLAVQLAPQLMFPEGEELVTVPVPTLVTLNR